MTGHRLLKVPESLGAALDAILHHFLNAKEIESEEYRRQVMPWELARYLLLY